DASDYDSDALGGGEEVVHGPGCFETLLADQGRELRVMAHAVQREMHQDGLARGAQAAGGDGVNGVLGGPVVAGIREKTSDETECELVCGVQRVDRVLGDLFVGRFGKAGQTLRVAELDGDDVLESVGDGLTVADVAEQGEDGGVGEDEVVPVLRGGVVPIDEFFGGEGGWHGYMQRTRTRVPEIFPLHLYTYIFTLCITKCTLFA